MTGNSPTRLLAYSPADSIPVSALYQDPENPRAGSDVPRDRLAPMARFRDGPDDRDEDERYRRLHRRQRSENPQIRAGQVARSQEIGEEPDDEVRAPDRDRGGPGAIGTAGRNVPRDETGEAGERFDEA